MIYHVVPADELLTQGDVIDGCPVVRALPAGGFEVQTARVVVLTQACDIAQTKADRVVVAAVFAADEAVARGELKAPAVRDQVRRGQVFGWYFLPAAPDPVPLPESIVNLRDLHTVPRTLLERLATEGKRVCRVLTPYREHLAQHSAVTYMRIALPEPYETRP
jgi:hypothetical protein